MLSNAISTKLHGDAVRSGTVGTPANPDWQVSFLADGAAGEE
jgi:hypothetical protein